MNLVEQWFAEITNKWLRRGTHRSVKELAASITQWVATWTDDPRPYVCHKTADEIFGSLAQYCQRISEIGTLPGTKFTVWSSLNQTSTMTKQAPVAPGLHS